MGFGCSSDSPIGASRAGASGFDAGIPPEDGNIATDTKADPHWGPLQVELGEDFFTPYIGCSVFIGPEAASDIHYFWEIIGPNESRAVSLFNKGVTGCDIAPYPLINQTTPACLVPDVPGDYTATITAFRPTDQQSAVATQSFFVPPVFQASLIWLPAGSFGISNLDFHYRQADAEWESEDGDISWHNMNNSPDWGMPRPAPGEPCHAALSCGCNELGWLDDPYYPVDAFNQDMSQEWIIHPLPAAGVYELGVANIAIDQKGQYLQDEPIVACLEASWLGSAITLLGASTEICFAIPPYQDVGIVTVATLEVPNGIKDRWATNNFTINESLSFLE